MTLKILALVCLSLLFLPKEVFVAKHLVNDPDFGKTVNLILRNDGTYNVKEIPENKRYFKPKSASGRYKIFRDIIFFEDSKLFSKGVLHGNYIELLGLFRVKIRTNRLDVKSVDQIKEPGDFAIFSLSEFQKRNFDPTDEPFYATSRDFDKIKAAIDSAFTSDTHNFTGKKQSDYYKQCVFTRKANGEIDVFVYGEAKESGISKQKWKSEIVLVSDGGTLTSR
ncbi:hypothetical protein [Flavobacterium sp.]|uniref:hypothetical protein n=1 Tax=Flavobacterium sp. TaxID=239 RepID=UPI00120F89A5|nr:hypothetical protein [Flavobacterium sp.]RZJ72257.1 MAG: hypothetical protein EOO49_07335 [Flavobacterium sp.]